LNDDFEGGEIFFPKLGERFKPRKYGGIYFHSKNNPFSFHQNTPVRKGEKYAIYVWIRE
jgi:predicted 2-oxoglutarate/Fe(II)-dependent dioxygenase YbiX